MISLNSAVDGLVALLKSARLDLSDEKRAQIDIEKILTHAGIEFARECRLSAGDIPDFLIGDIAVEIKLAGHQKKAIYKQICRYAAHERVNHVILASNISMGLPKEINGKSIYFVSLGRAWL